MKRPKTILFVDDNRDNLDLMVRMLKLDGYDVLPARFASHAIKILKTSSIDLLLFDINLAEISGIDLLKYIRGKEQWKHIPAIALSANAINSYRPLCLEAGFDSYLSKPITRKELVNVVKQTFEETSVNPQKLSYSSN